MQEVQKEQTLTLKEMLEIITEVRDSEGYRYINLNTDDIDTSIEYSNCENSQYKIEVVDQNGGNEGDGEAMDCTIKVMRKSDDIFGFVTFYGHYDSWNDCYYYSKRKTEPKEKTIIVYESVKEDK